MSTSGARPPQAMQAALADGVLDGEEEVALFQSLLPPPCRQDYADVSAAGREAVSNE